MVAIDESEPSIVLRTIKIHGGFGNTWGDNFYMGTQNGSNNKYKKKTIKN